MYPALLIPLALEAAWLLALYGCVPESRPWNSGHNPFGLPARNIVWGIPQRLLLYGYVLYHFPVVVVTWAFGIVNFNRVRPPGFLILGALTGT